MVCRDYFYLKNLPILASQDILPLLLPQSIWGRAQNGHGMFCDEQGRPLCFTDATMENVISSLGYEELGIQGRLVKRLRQEILAALERFLLDSIGKEKITFSGADNPRGNPFGITFLQGITVDSQAFFKGFVLGGLMDNWKKRRRAAKHFKVTLSGEPLILGGGESLLVMRDRFLQAGLDEQLVASREFSDREIEELRELEIIADESHNLERPAPVGVFFRRMAGPGVSDDAAIVHIGKTYGVDSMYGVLLADAADTYDKYLETYTENGHDEKLVHMVSERLGRGDDTFISEEEIRRLIYFSAKANYPAINVSSSHRRLIQVEPGSRVPSFLNHVEFVKGGKPARFPMGYNRYDSGKFYQAINQRAEILRLGW
ncbi:MAG: hypothetical protein U9N45_01445 [Gemmatimonadota bacterium]|nr:hypothetical protein [Gemmatimonadota bacterium]